MRLLRDGAGVLCVGHRGAAALAPENSLAAIEAAARAGADVVELDVVRGLRVTHEPDAAAAAPRLHEALALAASLGLAVQLDLKERGLAVGIAAALRAAGLEERSFASAAPRTILEELAAAAPWLPRSLSYPDDRHRISERRLLAPAVPLALSALRAVAPRRLPPLLRAVGARAATLDHRIVSTRAIDACHALGIAVLVWTVAEPERVRTLVESGVDAIITDDPRIVSEGISTT